MIRRARTAAAMLGVLLLAGVAPDPILGRVTWTSSKEPPTTIDIVVVTKDSSGAPLNGVCSNPVYYYGRSFQQYVQEVVKLESSPTWSDAPTTFWSIAEAAKTRGWWATMAATSSLSRCAQQYGVNVSDTTDDQRRSPGAGSADQNEGVNRSWATRMYDAAPTNGVGDPEIWRASHAAGYSTDLCGQYYGLYGSNILSQNGAHACAQSGVAWTTVLTSKYYAGIPSALENTLNFLVNWNFEYNGCGSATSVWLSSTGVTATTNCSSTNCSSTNNIDGTHFSRIDGTGAGNTNSYTAVYQDPWEEQTAAKSFTFSAWVRCLTPIPCDITPRLAGIGGTAETYDGSLYHLTDSAWHAVTVTHSFAYAHTKVRGMVRGSGKIKFDVDLTRLW